MSAGLFELRVPLFRPMWRRVALVVALFGWGAFEYSNQNAIWAMVFWAVGVLAVYQFFFAWKEPEEDRGGDGGDDGGGEGGDGGD